VYYILTNKNSTQNSYSLNILFMTDAHKPYNCVAVDHRIKVTGEEEGVEEQAHLQLM